MFLIVPAIIIFLAFSYLYVNDEISIMMQVFIYLFIVAIILFTFAIYKAIQRNLKQQEFNKILLEIHQLQKELKTCTKESQKEILNLKLEKLNNEINSYSI